MSTEPQVVPVLPPQPQYCIVFLSAGGEEGAAPKMSVNTVNGREELEKGIRAILSEYGEATLLKVFEGRQVETSEPARLSAWAVIVKFGDKDEKTIQTGGVTVF